jgi:hypothetical protein
MENFRPRTNGGETLCVVEATGARDPARLNWLAGRGRRGTLRQNGRMRKPGIFLVRNLLMSGFDIPIRRICRGRNSCLKKRRQADLALTIE